MGPFLFGFALGMLFVGGLIGSIPMIVVSVFAFLVFLIVG